MLIKDIKEQKVIAYIWREIYPVQELKVNMLISIDIITPENLFLILVKKQLLFGAVFVYLILT